MQFPIIRPSIFYFLDVFSDYYQIKMNEVDQVHTSFQAAEKVLCYHVMSFGMKNVVANTYQRMVNKMFENQIGRNVELYVDDMMIKIAAKESHQEDLNKTKLLRCFCLYLNV